MGEIFEYFQYGFIQRALVCGTFISLLCSTLGVLLVLRRLSMIGDGLSHAAFGSIALGLLLGVYPLYLSVPVLMVCSVGILKLTERARVYGDAAIGIVSSLGIAGGVVIVSAAGGFNVDLFSYLFGNILAISREEMYLSIALSIVVLLVVVCFYNEIYSITFDEEFARVSGIRTGRINNLVVLLTAVTVVLTINVVGILLISALLILPAVTAMQLSRSFRGTLLMAALTSALSVTGGIVLSLALNTPTGATIVLTGFGLFLCSLASRRVIPGNRGATSHNGPKG